METQTNPGCSPQMQKVIDGEADVILGPIFSVMSRLLCAGQSKRRLGIHRRRGGKLTRPGKLDMFANVVG